MADKMLIDASHAEETRVVVVRGNRIEEFDFESQHKKQLRGNIYLAKVTRVEPSLQAAFVDYGGNRHGFLAFSEIHPDYYQIPLADRQALLKAEAEEHRNDDEYESVPTAKDVSEPAPAEAEAADAAEAEEVPAAEPAPVEEAVAEEAVAAEPVAEESVAAEPVAEKPKRARKPRSRKKAAETVEAAEASSEAAEVPSGDEEGTPSAKAMSAHVDQISEEAPRSRSVDEDDDEVDDEKEVIESVGAEDAMEEVPERPVRKPRKQYRIQEVIKRRQILLVQVAKEERGNKGAALTTYLSLAGRYSVLMPNTARGGGISRKITNPADRKRLKEIAKDLEVPQGMGVILRTAGANRTKAEVKRDFEYLLRLWENVRTKTLNSTAPCLVYEEGSLIKRSIRDLYNKDISEIIVAGEEGYREAKDFMKMLMPSHAKVVQPYRDIHPIFSRAGIEAQLDRMLQPQVNLKSGGYIIINQTEALVAIDVNSGRSTREHSIEETALQTNLEAAEEVARQLRLRDLAGLVVIDFIDMEEKRNNRLVEKRLKEHLKQDRARIQVGRISHFGLLEMSRQRIRASVLESTMQVCSHCGGTGYVRSQSSVALHVLRGIEEFLLKSNTHNITVRTPVEIALYLLNQKRGTIVDYERRFGVSISIEADASVSTQHYVIDKGEPVENPIKIEPLIHFEEEEDEDDIPVVEEQDDEAEEKPVAAETTRQEARQEEGGKRKKRRRRRRGNRNGSAEAASGAESASQAASDEDDDADQGEASAADEASDDEAADAVAEGSSEAAQGEQPRKRRRRGKRGGRRGRENAEASAAGESETAEDGEGEEAAGDAAADAVAAEAPSEEAAPAVAEAAEADASAAEAVAEPAAEEAPKPRARRSRKTKAQLAAEAAAAEAAEAAAAAPAETSADVQSVEVPAPASEAVVPAAEAPAPAEETAEAQPEADQADSEGKSRTRANRGEAALTPPKEVIVTTSNGDPEAKPKKAGWWQKRGFL